MDALSTSLLIIGLFLVTGLLGGWLASRIGIPQVAGYVLAGMLYAPDFLGGVLALEVGAWSEQITTAALGVIAYLIGGSMTMAQMRRMGKIILAAAFGESLGAVLLVFAAFMLLAPAVSGISRLDLALVFAALAASTAPAATVAVLHQYRARGPLTTTLLGAVALDDALAIIFFSIILVLFDGATPQAHFWHALREISGALILGAAGGWALATVGRRVQTREMRLPVILGAILLIVGLAQLWQLSALLSAMALGFATRFFLRSGGEPLFSPIEYIENVVFVIFFTLAGAHFELAIFSQHITLILIYFLARALGKLLGAGWGGRLGGAPPQVVRWLGMGLLPQAGVAIGLALVLSHTPALHQISVVIVNVILATTLLYELVGPIAVRIALSHAGELGMKRGRSKL